MKNERSEMMMVTVSEGKKAFMSTVCATNIKQFEDANMIQTAGINTILMETKPKPNQSYHNSPSFSCFVSAFVWFSLNCSSPRNENEKKKHYSKEK